MIILESKIANLSAFSIPVSIMRANLRFFLQNTTLSALKVAKSAKKFKLRVRCVQKQTNYPTSPIPEKKNHSNHICRLFSLLHCRYKHIPTIHTHDWDGTFIDNTFYKGILLLSITVPNHGYRYLQCKKADHLIHLDGILRKVPSQPPRHALQIWHDQVYNLVPSKAKFLSK